MQFQVPQFIETEDRIIGPLTLRQFGFLTIGFGATLFLFYFLSLILWILLAMVINTITISLAFVKINGIPLPKVAMAAVGYFWKPKFYLWKKTASPTQKIERVGRAPIVEEKKNPLGDIWQKLLTSKAPIPTREKTTNSAIFNQSQTHQEKYEVFRKITGEKEIARRIDYK